MKFELLRNVATMLGESHLSLEALTKIRDNRHLFSTEVREQFEQFMADGRKLFFGDDGGA